MRSGLGPLVRKELTELRRDRRVLLLTLVLPVLLYPAVIGAMDRMQAQRESEVRDQTLHVAMSHGDQRLIRALGATEGLRLSIASLDSVLAWTKSGRAALGVELQVPSSPSATDTVRLHGRFTRESTQEALRRVEAALLEARSIERQERFEARGGVGDLASVLVLD